MTAAVAWADTLDRLRQAPALRGVRAYLVGGAVRDALLGREPRDLDLAVDADPAVLGPALAREVGGSYFLLAADTARLFLRDGSAVVDLHALRGSIEEDLRRRDYTIDAMAVPLEAAAADDLCPIDPLGGREDLRRRQVRLVSPAALEEDPLRLLRGPRLAAELDFSLEEATADDIRRRAGLLPRAAPERQRDELVRVLSTPRAAHGLRLLDDLGLLARLVPEIEATRGVEQPKEHYWDVFGHLLETVAALDMLLSTSPPEDGRELWSSFWAPLDSLAEELRRYLDDEPVLGRPRRALVKLAGLLHDVAKPQTKTFDASGRMRFFGHDKAGAQVAREVMARLRFSQRESDLVATAVAHHLRLGHMSHAGPPTARAIYRFYRDCGEAAWAILLLALADHLATVGPALSPQGWLVHVGLVHYVLMEPARREAVVAPPRLVTGDDLMEHLGLGPGPIIGRLLERVREAQAEGKVSTREEALALARRALKRETRGEEAD
ncbi:Multifunctional CCA protein [bacterium HR24]|nr:Multifunctional CCA protein [bacterium HR24]